MRPKLLVEYDKDLKIWVVTDKCSSGTEGRFKPKSFGYRMILFVKGKYGSSCVRGCRRSKMP